MSYRVSVCEIIWLSWNWNRNYSKLEYVQENENNLQFIILFLVGCGLYKSWATQHYLQSNFDQKPLRKMRNLIPSNQVQTFWEGLKKPPNLFWNNFMALSEIEIFILCLAKYNWKNCCRIKKIKFQRVWKRRHKYTLKIP